MKRLLAGGESTNLDLLRRRDPRMKLLLLMSLIVGVFASVDFVRLAFFVAPLLLILCWRPAIFKLLFRRLWFLRWLLLFTLVLHLLLTPGQTLFGTRLFSYDGLLRGLMVDLQLVLALAFTLLFALSTSADRIAWAGMQLLKPLGRVGVDVRALADQLAMVLHFLPQVFAEGSLLVREDRSAVGQGISGRLELLARRVGDLVLRLVEVADQAARERAEGKLPVGFEEFTHRWAWPDSLWLSGGILLVLASWRG